jgi:predicted nucleotidyltransferase
MGKRKYREKMVREIMEFKKKIEKKFYVEKIIIFGSAARGEMGRHSDVDLIVVSKKFGMRNFFEVVPKLYGEWYLRYPVDFIIYNKKEFNKLKKEVSIVSEALKEGIEI